MKTLFPLFLLALTLAVPLMAHAAPSRVSPAMPISYDSTKQLIKNYYVAREACRSDMGDPIKTETTILCDYADAASKELTRLGYCFGHGGQSEAERQWEKCREKQ